MQSIQSFVFDLFFALIMKIGIRRTPSFVVYLKSTPNNASIWYSLISMFHKSKRAASEFLRDEFYYVDVWNFHLDMFARYCSGWIIRQADA